MERDADDIVSEEGKGEIQLTSEDYLQGVIGMVNELVSTIAHLALMLAS